MTVSYHFQWRHLGSSCCTHTCTIAVALGGISLLIYTSSAAAHANAAAWSCQNTGPIISLAFSLPSIGCNFTQKPQLFLWLSGCYIVIHLLHWPSPILHLSTHCPCFSSSLFLTELPSDVSSPVMPDLGSPPKTQPLPHQIPLVNS